MSKIIHAYWEIRGLGQPIRLLLEHAGANYEDKRYYTGPAPDFDKSGWLKEKFELGLEFPNLPYIIDGDVRLSQTHAIMRYLGRKFGLVGRNEEETRRVDLAEQQIADIRSLFVRLSYTPQPEHDKLKPTALEHWRPMLKQFSAFLGTNKWLAGDQLTFADFLAYEIFFQLEVFDKESFAGLNNLTEYLRRFEALPKIDAYMKSDRFIKWPFNNNMATYGARTQPCPF